MPTGEFGGFGLFEVLLMVSCVFAVLLALFRSLCMPVRVVDGSATLPEPFGSFRHQDPVPIGKLGGF